MTYSPSHVLIRNFLSREECDRLLSSVQKWVFKSRTLAGRKTSYTYAEFKTDRTISRKLLAAISQQPWDIRFRPQVRYSMLRYLPGDSTRPHVDYTPNVNAKITVVALLQKPAKGGCFILHERERIRMNIGSLVIFPSLAMHAVEVIEKGERISLAAWVSGPSFV